VVTGPLLGIGGDEHEGNNGNASMTKATRLPRARQQPTLNFMFMQAMANARDRIF
jgi:hypothetical protein